MKKLLIGLAVATAAVFGGMLHNQSVSAAAPRDCDNNSIIYCGALTQSELRSKYAANSTHDLPQLYSHYGISSSMINSQTAKMGYVTKTGNVVVNGQVVATGARSVGRQYMNGSSSFSVAGHTFYERATSTSFASSQISAMVFFDGYGKYEAAVLTSCGNAVKATPTPKPVYQCTALNSTKVDNNTYKFQASAFVRDASFQSVTYVVKDKTGKVVSQIKSANLNAVTYKQAVAGTYTVQAVVSVSVNGKTVTAPVGDCVKSFTVAPPKVVPVYACTNLSVSQVADERTKFTFQAAAQTSNATFNSVVYTVKDVSGKTVASVTRNDLNKYTYTQATAGTYKVSTTLTFTADGKSVSVSDAKCVASFTVKPAPVYQCNGLAVTQIDRTSFSFKPQATAQNGASFQDITYNVTDASGKVVSSIKRTDLNAITYTQTNVGTYKVNTTLNFNVNGTTTAVSDAKCVGQIQVTSLPVTPVYECSALTTQSVAGQTNTYKFLVGYKAAGGATLKTVAIDFTGKGDSNAYTPDQLNNITYTYAQAGTYTATATLQFAVNGDTPTVKSVQCSTPVTITEMCTVPGKETLPAGSTECVEHCTVPGQESLPANSPECAYCKESGLQNLPVNSPECVPAVPTTPVTPTTPATPASTVLPTVLPNTGAGSIVSLFGATSIVSFLGYRLILGRRLNRASL